jgi:hypothetical protein
MFPFPAPPHHALQAYLLRNILGLAEWLKWWHNCLASVRPRVQALVILLFLISTINAIFFIDVHNKVFENFKEF